MSKFDVSSPNFNWSELGFSYRQTNCHIIYKFKGGQWDKGELVSEPYLPIHIAATTLHYGQNCFDGLKAFRMKDGKVRVFRPQANGERIIQSCEYCMMAPPTIEMFLDGIKRVIKANIEYVPPYGSGASLYIRPVLFGTQAKVGVSSSDEFAFIIFVTPVSDYYKGGMSNPVRSLIMANSDRAAPYGSGHVKIGGNYVATVRSSYLAKKRGYPILLFLDSATKTYIEEFTTSNFFALTPCDSRGKRHYVTPKSHSILNSVTNMSLERIAKEILGWEVERRRINISEVEEGKFNEIAACGTAVVITPVGEIDREIIKEDGNIDIEKNIIGDGTTVGSGLTDLYQTLIHIQNGEIEDPFEWMWPTNGIEAEN
ncbi:branched-chain amino acid aminotransferase [Neocallimastix lanati (nom. inval.)]|uniref:Branched-chain amino acid aminotransferase n=1 Tax=Neocallimastix californiae TaxID=1754190 RepID=A0A1Y2CUQ8_9FUNG|nr:branched-chain amino acid aminotransferase [Neocallimastix sp. JGI-2020a]ORY50616.1 branched-chain amino acid aminotransferase [Neocallimastix californiae]|eukprot:ORY50616.1 branched-chain amino acid aminotransferase [Neocallimastix californiae]